MNRLVKFKFYGGHGSLHGLFIASEGDWAKLQEVQTSGRHVYFGEVLGKHSDVSGSIEEGDLTVLSDDQDLIQRLLVANQEKANIIGFNPLDYLGREP